MARPRVPVLLAAAAALLGFLQTSFSFEVKESGKICITADLLVNFSVEYPAKGHQEMANFALPQTGTVLLHNSTCGKGDAPTPVLVIGFGMGQSLSLKFMKTSNQYRVEELTFSYNLSDAAFFPSASAGEYECTRDKPMTTIATTTARQTTSQVPTTTSPAPTTLPQNPAVGKYNVTGKNGTCVLASMGLQLNVSYESKDGKTGLDVLNFIPSNTSFSGNCDNSSAFLNLTFGKAKLIFHFVRNTSIEKFFLQGVTVSTTLPPEAKKPQFEAVNNSMSELGASVGNSYMCNAEETLLVTQGAFVNLFSVQVQVFKIDGDKFGAVEECQLDENNMLIPIIVGAALAGLVLIVLIAYLIGRKRSHAGYQTI
ncbi:lysosome-associated membrane glycoprotein 1 isoform X4 [Alligator sinensis]|uniref:Lysosome-associated membrane glycoprotein 1 n=1 Tax=Alligator sinensis TaxID=38654 RepID=A0A3Q0FWD7_ALLSI|nr:lysosome-associated membrane glycoprotein 1 isoform X4 [Alligator sinensis]